MKGDVSCMYSKIFGEVSVEQMVEHIKNFINSNKNCDYVIAIGTDSQNTSLTKIDIVVAIHRVGNGGIFFYEEKKVKKIKDRTQKIYYETALSLEIASKISLFLAESNIKQKIEIHVDIGKQGPTRDLIQGIMGWVKSEGYICKIKPYSWAASSIANRLSK